MRGSGHFLRKHHRCCAFNSCFFRRDGAKINEYVEYKEELLFPQYEVSKGQVATSTNVKYQLIAVFVHVGATLSSGHYVSYMKRGGIWYSADDQHVVETTVFNVKNQKAYLLFYEQAEDEEVLEVRPVNALEPLEEGTASSSNPQEVIHIKWCIPPNFYFYSPQNGQQVPKLVQTAPGDNQMRYYSLTPEAIQKAVDITTAGMEIDSHPRVKSWEPDDISKLLPASHNHCLHYS